VLFVFVSVVNTELFHRNCSLSVHENIHGSHSSIPKPLEVAWEWSYGLGMGLGWAHPFSYGVQGTL